MTTGKFLETNSSDTMSLQGLTCFFQKKRGRAQFDPQQIGDMRSSRGDFLSGQTFQKERTMESQCGKPPTYARTLDRYHNFQFRTIKCWTYQLPRSTIPPFSRNISWNFFWPWKKFRNALGRTYGEQEIFLGIRSKKTESRGQGKKNFHRKNEKCFLKPRIKKLTHG